MQKILIAGDFCPKDRVAELVDFGNYEAVFSEVKPIVEDADYALVNLEAPIVKGTGTPIKKSGPNLKCSPNVVDAIRYAGFNGVTLANNHFRDYGDDGAQTTIDELKKTGLDYVGAGNGAINAARTLYKEIGGQTFAFINCCEHEFSVTTDEQKTGCNGLDVISQYHAIHEAKRKAKYVIMIVHGGIEMYQLPTPRMVRTYRFFIEAGADVVVNHHQHCFSGFEYYHEKPIVYGLGNFCFDRKGTTNDIWFNGYMAQFFFNEGNISFMPIPYRQCDDQPSVQLSVVDKPMFEQQIQKLCNIISDEKLLAAEYESFLQKTWRNYDLISPYANRYVNWLYKKGLLPSIMPKKKLYSILNAIRCESHQERLLDALNKKLEK